MRVWGIRWLQPEGEAKQRGWADRFVANNKGSLASPSFRDASTLLFMTVQSQSPSYAGPGTNWELHRPNSVHWTSKILSSFCWVIFLLAKEWNCLTKGSGKHLPELVEELWRSIQPGRRKWGTGKHVRHPFCWFWAVRQVLDSLCTFTLQTSSFGSDYSYFTGNLSLVGMETAVKSWSSQVMSMHSSINPWNICLHQNVSSVKCEEKVSWWNVSLITKL